MSEHRDLAKLALGRLTWDAIPLHDPILLATFIVVAVGGVATVVALTYFRAWGTLWRDWITSIDHKKIGVMYVILGLVMLLRGITSPRITYMTPIFLWSMLVIQSRHNVPHARKYVSAPTVATPPS